jgi:hypothetical protein
MRPICQAPEYTTKSGSSLPGCGGRGDADGDVWTANFGATPYAFTPPSGGRKLVGRPSAILSGGLLCLRGDCRQIVRHSGLAPRARHPDQPPVAPPLRWRSYRRRTPTASLRGAVRRSLLCRADTGAWPISNRSPLRTVPTGRARSLHFFGCGLPSYRRRAF